VAERPPQFLNRELSWLEFNARVLEEATDPGVPLLERLKFLAITGSNLDEFFMVRVGGLQQLLEQGKNVFDPAGLTTTRQLAEIRRRTQKLIADQYGCLLDELEVLMQEGGIRRLTLEEVTPEQAAHLERVFEHEIYPIITPMAVQTAQFPLLTGLAINLIVRFKPAAASSRKPRYAVIPIPRRLNRFITLPSRAGHKYILLEDVIAGHLSRLFPGEPIVEHASFRLTRNADMSVREDLAGDLLFQMREVLDARKSSACVRLELSGSASRTTLEFLRRILRVREESIYQIPGPLDLAALINLAHMAGFENLKYPSWQPQPPPEIQPNDSMFDALSRRDLLLFHPYDSFEPVVRLIDQAADDPDVLAIKQILYRTSQGSPIVLALARAATKGKHVTAIVELKARFDEARNIDWARALELAGVQVIYGLAKLKVHAKICIIVRREPTGIRRYVHFGTGNYNEVTAGLYSDISFMTSQEDYGADATAFFNAITGYSQPMRYKKIEAAPIGLRAHLLKLIENEMLRCQQGQKGLIMAKLNSLVDAEIIQALYKASRAGVKIQLNVRGICCLRPGVPGLSENIQVVSIVDRFLEHARILYFHHGGDPLVFISSADWMPRNLDRRVELLVPVEDPACRMKLINILETCFRDTAKARILQPDGHYVRAAPPGTPTVFRSQQAFCNQAQAAARQVQKDRYQTFEPQLPAAVSS
jgi:polyphosphate kinase